MIDSITDYENWRDSLQDRPMPDTNGPDERAYRFYSHDYPADTTLEYTRSGNRAELKLSFSSEDPDMGTEEMLYGGENGESMLELVSDLRNDLTAWLDAQDTSSFREQQGLADEIHSQDDYYGEFSRTALYAFEALLTETEREGQKVVWTPMQPYRKDWMYSASQDSMQEKACVGHLRGDFGRSGQEFWTSWFDHQPQLKDAAFQQELQEAVNDLRGKDGLLQSFASMSRQCGTGLRSGDSFGFQGESRNHLYCLRCNPRKGDYNFYLYAYDKSALREMEKAQAAEKPQHVKPKIKKHEMER